MVGHNRHVLVDEPNHVLGVEVGQAQIQNTVALLLVHQMRHRVEVVLVVVVPPVELQQVDGVDAHARKAALDGRARERARDLLRARHPLSEELAALGRAARQRALAEGTDELFRGSVYIGQVESGKPFPYKAKKNVLSYVMDIIYERDD